MIAALDWARRRDPRRLICAAPVGSGEAIAWARSHADQVICPWRPAAFGAVSRFYARFEQVSDEEVERCLGEWRTRQAAIPPQAAVDQAPRSNSRM
jgi:predicted phosphoribosyltransferase